ncbi:tyrosine-type recombinase/integrase [Labrys sp. ZIDIC5]|uniref:tyrosine-type recombinase/integrase n=1 Tax=Labrys sedimenti TaxID=3106036 RepID=UPI002ACA922F|nr:integrase arm-type DNA-binding domain-containing protein [Labrys sp. ZIDIC5]MDZ5448610.1 integrase arm-type DNA-binding domain-containing protein [Labrys sp. ZIDIC5]
MARQLNKLSARAVQAVTRPGRYGDGGGLSLVVSADGRRRWVYRFTIDGKTQDLGLGGARDMGLARARELATDARRLVSEGKNPLDARVAAKQEAAAKAITFGDAADDLIKSMAPGWKNAKHKAQWEMTLGNTYCKSIRAMDVAKIRTEHVLAVLKPIWQAKAETASRIRGRIERVLNSAKAAGFIRSPWENPARWSGHLDHILPKRAKLTRGHHEAMPYDQLPAFIKALHTREGNAALGLELTILTAARTGEIINARLSEFDIEKAIWIIPAERMKAKREHRVPLSPRAVEIVETLRLQKSEWLLPGSQPTKAISNMAMAMLLTRMDQDVTVHGFRSAFKDWAAECTPFPNEVSEAALAHIVGDKVEAAYRRGDLFEKRRKLMEAWATFCSTPPAGNVVPMHRAATP